MSVSGPLDAETGPPTELTVYHLLYTPGAFPDDIGLPGEPDARARTCATPAATTLT